MTFCNPYAGHEKGSVENAVGFLRRNLMVPVPAAPTLDELNARLLEGCMRLLDAERTPGGPTVRESSGRTSPPASPSRPTASTR